MERTARDGTGKGEGAWKRGPFVLAFHFSNAAQLCGRSDSAQLTFVCRKVPIIVMLIALFSLPFVPEGFVRMGSTELRRGGGGDRDRGRGRKPVAVRRYGGWGRLIQAFQRVGARIQYQGPHTAY